ncbi:unnamed protein product [Sphenostylis stenocarpa]|uniref:GYF domain-containing protein n=1 Tax=Sphenostylis stenocarpa TaxID=92480 RepID=A0AA86VFN1_9FABA|nr:unnamed protein product [Sphenostylis stenocarpa]
MWYLNLPADKLMMCNAFPLLLDIEMIRTMGLRDSLDFVEVMHRRCLSILHMCKYTISDLHRGESGLEDEGDDDPPDTKRGAFDWFSKCLGDQLARGVLELMYENCITVTKGNSSLVFTLSYLVSIPPVEIIAQDVENDKGVPTLDSSQPGGEKSQSNKVLHVYTRRNLQQKKVQPIIPTMEQMDSIISPEDVPGPKSPVKENQDGTAFPVAGTASLFKDSPHKNLPQSSTSKGRQDDPDAKAFEELSNPEKYGLCQPRNTKSGSVIINGRNLNAKQDANISAIPVEEQELSTPTTNVIVLSDDDEQEANTANFPGGRKAVESPDISIWYCVGPYGEKGGPYTMSALKRWSETSSNPLEFKVWKTGQSETEAIPLSDTLKRFFSSMQVNGNEG